MTLLFLTTCPMHVLNPYSESEILKPIDQNLQVCRFLRTMKTFATVLAAIFIVSLGQPYRPMFCPQYRNISVLFHGLAGTPIRSTLSKYIIGLQKNCSQICLQICDNIIVPGRPIISVSQALPQHPVLYHQEV